MSAASAGSGRPSATRGGAASSAPAPRLARSAGIVAAAVFASRILGLVREQVFAALFGASRELDAFITAFRIPNLFRDLLAEGALSSAFVASFARRLEREGEESAWRLANLVLNALGVAVGGLVVAGILFSPAIVELMAPGFASSPGKTELTVRLTRVMFPFLLLVSLAAVVMGILNTRERFGVAASASSFFNVGSVVGGLGFAWWLAPDYVRHVVGLVTLGGAAADADWRDGTERAIVGMALGTVLGGLMQLLGQWPTLRGLRFRWRPVLSFRDPGVREVMALMGPATIGAAAVQVNVFVNNNFASYLGDGPVSWLNVAFRFMQLPIGMFGVAVGTVALPAISRSAARADAGRMRDVLSRSLRMVLCLTIPASVALAVLAPDLIGVVYQHGHFGPRDTAMASRALVAYALGLAGYANVKVLVPAFYALDDARTPMLVSCLSILTNFCLNWFTVRKLGLGHTGLAMGTSAVAFVNFSLLLVILRGRLGGWPSLVPAVLRISAASLVLGIGCLAAQRLSALALPGGSFGGRILSLMLAASLGGAGFLWTARALGLEEARTIAARLGRLRPAWARR